MTPALKMTLMAAVAVGAVMALAPQCADAQAAGQANANNAAPDPYKMDANWAQLPDGRKFGAAIKVQVDHRDGKTIWVFDRCGTNSCRNSMVPPIQKFDASGKFVRTFGAGMFNNPHGFYVDKDGNVWATDFQAKNGKGDVVVKFSPEGKVLMTLGKTGMPGNTQDTFDEPSAIVVAPNGDFYVADGHGGTSNDRIVKFDKNGKFLMTWGEHGKGQGEFDTPHGIALDSAGRVYVADRANNRVEVFDPNGKFIAEWKQFGRPSDVAIDKNDMIYVADSQSTERNNPGFKQGIRIGSVKDGKVTAFIPEPTDLAAGAEGVGVDDAGNVYGGWTAKMTLRRFVKSSAATTGAGGTPNR
jgi:DNA-binding beta-propeller fold protein YncE